MTKTKRLRVLQEIYDSMPVVGCKGLCTAACAGIPVMPLELEQLEAHAGRKLATKRYGVDDGSKITVLGDIGKPCELLVLGRCTAYEVRPIICRAYGAAQGLPCAHGCKVERVLPDSWQHAMFDRVAKL